MVKLHLELEGEVGEVVRVLRRIGGGDNGRRRGSGWAAPCPNGGESIGWGHCSGARDNGNFCSVASRPLDGGASCRLHVGPGTGGPAGGAARVEGRRKGHPSEHTLPEDGPDAGGVALVGDEDGPRAGEVPAGGGLALSRPVAANSPLQSYFVDPDFAAVASDLFGERMPDQLSSGLMRP